MGSHHVNVGGELLKKRLKDGRVIEEFKHENVPESHVDLNRLK